MEKVSKNFEKRLVLMLMVFLLSFTHLLLGPSEVFNFPNSLVLMGIGSVFMGLFVAGMLILALPEMIEVLSLYYPNSKPSLKEDTVAFYT